MPHSGKPIRAVVAATTPGPSGVSSTSSRSSVVASRTVSSPATSSHTGPRPVASPRNETTACFFRPGSRAMSPTPGESSRTPEAVPPRPRAENLISAVAGSSCQTPVRSTVAGGQLGIHEGAEAPHLLDQHGKVLIDQPDDGVGGAPKCFAGTCAAFCSTPSPDQTVQWGRKVTGVRPLGDGRHELTFTGGATVTSALLVGADGVWSKVRPLVSDAKPRYTGTTFIETYLHDADEQHAEAAEAVGSGAMYALTPAAMGPRTSTSA